MELQIQVNQNIVKDSLPLTVGGSTLLLCPPINDEYWLLRVPVSDSQAIVCFPKFGTIGIGFQYEDDWNTNLPYRCETSEIWQHIDHNKGDESIPDERCIQAIDLIKSAIVDMNLMTRTTP